MNGGFDLDTVQNFGTALLIGALAGIEREKRKSVEGETGIGGLRTFVLTALLGAIGGALQASLSTTRATQVARAPRAPIGATWRPSPPTRCSRR